MRRRKQGQNVAVRKCEEEGKDRISKKTRNLDVLAGKHISEGVRNMHDTWKTREVVFNGNQQDSEIDTSREHLD